MNGHRARKAMLNQLRNGIIRNQDKVVRREIKSKSENASLWDKIKWALGWGTI